MLPQYDFDKVKLATDGPTFEKGVALYESGKVIDFQEGIRAYSAIVQGTKPYQVSVEARRYGDGHCECYLGQRDILCKHRVAVAIRAVTGGKPLSDKDKKRLRPLPCSSRVGELSQGEVVATKKAITAAMRYIKPYHGPSRVWFSYQHSLEEGCNRLAQIVAELPVSPQTAGLLLEMLWRLDRKLSRSGVDDSNGTVGGFMKETVQVLREYATLDPFCVESFQKLKGRETCFGWEAPLLVYITTD